MLILSTFEMLYLKRRGRKDLYLLRFTLFKFQHVLCQVSFSLTLFQETRNKVKQCPKSFYTERKEDMSDMWELCYRFWDTTVSWAAWVIQRNFMSAWNESSHTVKLTLLCVLCLGYPGQDFDWADYLKQCGAEAAPQSCFPSVRFSCRKASFLLGKLYVWFQLEEPFCMFLT